MFSDVPGPSSHCLNPLKPLFSAAPTTQPDGLGSTPLAPTHRLQIGRNPVENFFGLNDCGCTPGVWTTLHLYGIGSHRGLVWTG